MATRRHVLFGGASLAAVAFAALSYRAWDRGVWAAGTGSPYAPWSEWDGTSDGIIGRPLRAAILAANPHNTQPWLFEIADNAITVFADRTRHLGTFDPFRREMHLGLGAAIENLVIASRAFGMTAVVSPTEGTLPLSPANVAISAAHIDFTAAAPIGDKLFDAIPNRHTNRGPYRADHSIGRQHLQRFADLVTNDVVRVAFIEDAHARAELGAIIVEATDRIVGDEQMSADSARWFRTGRRDIQTHRDGVTIDTSGATPLMTAVAKLLPDLDAKSADRYWLSMTRDIHIATASVLGVILVRDRLDMRGAIEAGRSWQRLHLAATAKGLAAQPLNQPIEWGDRAAMLGATDGFGSEIGKLVSSAGWEPTFVFRLGIAEQPAGRSPRRPLEEVLRT